MDRRPAGFASAFRNYEDFQPSSSLVQEEKSDTLIINLPAGFRKEQIRVQIDGFGTLKLSGERPLGDNKWSRFRKDYRTPTNCNTSEIRAKFENGVLHIIMPKTVTTTTPTTTPKPPNPPEPLAPPPSQKPNTTTPTKQTPQSQTDSSKIPTPPPPPPPVVLPPPSQKPVATESSKISPAKPPVGAPPSQKPTLTTEATVPTPPPPPQTTQTQPTPPSQTSTAASPTTAPTTKVPADDMEPKTDHHHKDNNQQKKTKKKVSMSSTHEYIEDKWNKHVGKGQNTEKEYGGDGIGKTKMHESTGENKVSHSGGGGSTSLISDKASSIIEDYKNKFEGFMVELKKKTSTTASSSTSNDDNRSELLVNMAVASLVVVALGAYVTWNFKSSWNKHS